MSVTMNILMILAMLLLLGLLITLTILKTPKHKKEKYQDYSNNNPSNPEISVCNRQVNACSCYNDCLGDILVGNRTKEEVNKCCQKCKGEYATNMDNMPPLTPCSSVYC